MIGSGFKKFALENGLKVAKGVGYGSLRGYWTTLSEGSGFKRFVISTKFLQQEKLIDLRLALSQINLKKEYRILQLEFLPDSILIVFQDNPGTMKKIEAFTDYFFPLLQQAEATGSHICYSCGQPITDGGVPLLIDGVSICCHAACAEKEKRDLAVSKETRKQEQTGSYAMGALGALLGAAVGAVVWAIVLYGGYIASLVGLLIGFLALKGYDLLHGKQGKGKLPILIVTVVLGVVLGTVGSILLQIVELMSDGTFMGGAEYIFWYLEEVLSYPDVQTALLKDMGLGLLFAALGVAGIFAKTGKEVSGSRIQDLPK